MNELPQCLCCDASYASAGALRCATCYIEADLAATGAIATTDQFALALGHRPKTQWPFAITLFGALALVPLCLLVSREMRASTAAVITCLGFAALFGSCAIHAVARLLRPRAAAPATVVGLSWIELAAVDSTYTSLRVTLAFADGSVRALVPPQLTELALDRSSLGTRVIAFADDEWVYDVWPVR